MTPDRVIERVLNKVAIEGDCVVSLYSTGSHGYTQVSWQVGEKKGGSVCHRVAWEAVYGPIPAGMTVDHMCRNRRCVNPAHLRLLTNVENATDNGHGRKTHCPHGHPYDEANTAFDRNGHRRCRACDRARNSVRYRKAA